MTGSVIRGRASRTPLPNARDTVAPLPQNKKPGAEGFLPQPPACISFLAHWSTDQLINYFGVGTR